ncbi:VOC family protein [Oceanobacillus polygoni]|uniref:PhnB protein n=1 Tax=Oceanobacillus polygoni TaxID=1235259 RepID=A0A9X0YSP9_9BACI|nr:VOC family protein [Oceanobacillus polygoni]MBP2078018.1 PhnB protein [Oceanobacillus polygoni]
MGLQINPYIMLDGRGKEAVDFYKHALGANVVGVHTYREMPESPEFQLPAEAKDRVMHAKLTLGNTELMISDIFPGQPYQLGSQLTIALIPSTADEAKDVYEKLQEGGQIIMELQETDWSPAYGQVTDKFGITWQISTEMK